MNELTYNIERPERTLGMNPVKFILWLIIVSIIMFFAAMTSACMVKSADGNWLTFEMPAILTYSNIVVIASSVFLHLSYLNFNKDEFIKGNLFITLTFVFGIVFLVFQYLGFAELIKNKIYFAGPSSNPSGSFFYIIVVMHALHLIAGLAFLLIVFIKAIKSEIHSKSMNTIEMCCTFWHFLSLLWIYLFFFLKLSH